jgi:hypothetical protein
MIEFPARRAFVRAAAACALVPGVSARAQFSGLRHAYGNRFDPNARVSVRRIRTARLRAMDTLREWHTIALEATGIDHTPVAPGETRTFGEQLGPGRSARAMAIVHIAMFDVLNTVARRYRGYADSAAAPRGAAIDAALAQAAHDALVAVFPSQRDDFDEALAQELASVRDVPGRTAGVALGQRVASAILALRASDGAAHSEPRSASISSQVQTRARGGRIRSARRRSPSVRSIGTCLLRRGGVPGAARVL